jgi:tRNA 2-thiouridine synthesizing protein A
MSEARIIDGRDMVPPEPLEHTLAALETLPDGEFLTVLLYCQPHPLYKVLRLNGYCWDEALLTDGTREIRIRKAPAAGS